MLDCVNAERKRKLKKTRSGKTFRGATPNDSDRLNLQKVDTPTTEYILFYPNIRRQANFQRVAVSSCSGAFRGVPHSRTSRKAFEMENTEIQNPGSSAQCQSGMTSSPRARDVTPAVNPESNSPQTQRYSFIQDIVAVESSARPPARSFVREVAVRLGTRIAEVSFVSGLPCNTQN